MAFLQRLAGVCFSLLGASFFVSYVLLRNDLHADEAAWWMQVADLPLALTAIVYGGTSVYRSLRNPRQPSTLLPWLIGIPLTGIFVLVVIMNFWKA